MLENLEKQIFLLTFASHLKTRAFSSAGLEHLPYKQRVGGSNPSTPTVVFPVISSEVAGFFRLYTSRLKCNLGSFGLSGNLVGISINLCKSIQKELFINDTS